MIDPNRLITGEDRLLGADKSEFDFRPFDREGNPARGRARFNGSKYEKLLEIGAKLYVAPDFDPETQVLDGVRIEYSDYITEGVRNKTLAEIENEREVVIAAVLSAAKQHIEKEIDPDGMLLVDRLIRIDSPNVKALACEAWLISIRKEAYARVNTIRSGGAYVGDPLDFSSFGIKPYTIEELMAEAGL